MASHSGRPACELADSQVASRWGNILEFQGFDLITPNEREARFSLGYEDWLIRPLALDLYNKSELQNAKFSSWVIAARSPTARIRRQVRAFFTLDSFAKNVVDPGRPRRRPAGLLDAPRFAQAQPPWWRRSSASIAAGQRPCGARRQLARSSPTATPRPLDQLERKSPSTHEVDRGGARHSGAQAEADRRSRPAPRRWIRCTPTPTIARSKKCLLETYDAARAVCARRRQAAGLWNICFRHGKHVLVEKLARSAGLTREARSDCEISHQAERRPSATPPTTTASSRTWRIWRACSTKSGLGTAVLGADVLRQRHRRPTCAPAVARSRPGGDSGPPARTCSTSSTSLCGPTRRQPLEIWTANRPSKTTPTTTPCWEQQLPARLPSKWK